LHPQYRSNVLKQVRKNFKKFRNKFGLRRKKVVVLQPGSEKDRGKTGKKAFKIFQKKIWII